MNNKELRCAVQELRAAGADAAPKIEGYAATFNTVANIGSFNEVIQPGAFTRTLADGDEVVALVDHNPSMILGRRSAGTLTLEQDDKGLFFSCLLPDTTVARDAYANLRAGNLKECSFGFFVEDEADEEWTRTADGTPLRTLKSVRLFDCSVVAFPAYGNTSANARNVVSPLAEKRMVAFAAQNELEARRKRVQSVLDEHQEWQNREAQAAADAEAQHRLNQLRLSIAKLR